MPQLELAAVHVAEAERTDAADHEQCDNGDGDGHAHLPSWPAGSAQARRLLKPTNKSFEHIPVCNRRSQTVRASNSAANWRSLRGK